MGPLVVVFARWIADGNLVSIAERVKVYTEGNKIIYEESDAKKELPADTSVSMNFWCFHPNAFDYIQKLFQKFLEENGDKPKAEFFIPIVGDAFIQEKKGEIKVIPTSAQWFGVTYKEDAPGVKESIEALVESGAYPKKLWD